MVHIMDEPDGWALIRRTDQNPSYDFWSVKLTKPHPLYGPESVIRILVIWILVSIIDEPSSVKRTRIRHTDFGQYNR